MEILRNVELSKLTSIRIGGRANFLALPESFEEVREAVLLAREKDMPLYVLGGGSNTIFGNVRGIVLNMERLSGFEIHSENGRVLINALAGTPLKEIVGFAVRKNLSGIYKLLGFPASVGGAVAMNAGAFGVELSSFIRRVLFMNWEGRIEEAESGELEFSYRSSPFPREGLVLACILELEPSDEPVLEEYRRIREARKSKQPINKPTSGSTFKNPYPLYAGELLEKVGMKGFGVGGVSFSELHANFLVNHGEGTFGDVLKLISEAKRRVLEEFGVSLEEEVRLVEDSGSSGWKVL